MALIGPYVVSIRSHDDFPGDLIGDRLVYGVSGYGCADAWMRWRLRVSRMGLRTRLWRERFLVSSPRLSAWRACVLRSPSLLSSSGEGGGGAGRDWYLHGFDRRDAQSRASRALGYPADDLFVEGAEDWQVLDGVPDAELEWLCRMVWTGRMSSSEFGRRVPGIERRWRRRFDGEGGRGLTGTLRVQAVQALCLAQVYPGWGPKLVPRLADEGPPRTGIHWERREPKLRALHAPNVDRSVIDACFEVGFRQKVEPFRPDQRHALAALARAYGFDPHSMSVLQMAELWEQGPAAFDDDD